MMEKARSNHLRLLRLGIICLLVSADPVSGSAGFDASGLLGTLHWRSIGPATGGRVTTVTGVASRPLVYYLGSTGGGVWKTGDGGLTWNPISDGFFRTGSVGAVAVADSDPNLVYAGTGEACLRNDISHGDGVYKSLDAGKTWKHMGLDDSRHISRIRIHPRNADLVYVGALGDVYAPSQQSGVFRSRDGGKSWENVLPVDENTGASDLIMDPNNPRILYAGMWQVNIKPWGIYSGGSGSGLYKTTDGGDTWVELTNGLPRGVKGRIGVAVSPVAPDRVWALVEADDGGLFRSEDAGWSWRKVNDDFQLRRRHYYYTHVYADTQVRDTVYVLTSPFLKSVDGGRSFRPVRVPHGDNHDLWIAPDNNQRMINSNDGGANVSLNGGKSWTRQDTQATRQLYHVTTDNQFPYRVYGSQQDGSTISVSSRSGRFRFGALPDRYPVGGGESGYIAVDPRDANIVYGGSYWGRITRYDHRSKEIRNISISPDLPAGRPSADWKYRFDWTFPIVFSPHDPATLYAGGNVLFKTTNEGQSWQAISPDLTRNDTSKLQDGRLSQIYCTIFSVAESQKQRDLIWVGTSDGLVQLTRNGGKTWENVTPPEMPEWSRISLVEPSSHNAAAAYLAVNRFDLGDNRPYLYKTDDYGKTWEQITNGIRAGDFVRAVREDPKRQGLLYAGTETGVYVSLDDGERWQSLQLNLPAVPVHDLIVKEDDLVIATHGRSFWILDDITLLQHLTREVISSDVYLFQPRDVYRARGFTAGINYYLQDKPSEGVTLELLDAGGNLIRRLSSGGQRPGLAPGRQEFFGRGLAGNWIPRRRGMNRFQWDLRYPNGRKIRGAPTFLFGGNLRGPVALPGSYQVRITIGKESQTRQFQIKEDPRSGASLADLKRQFDLLISIRDRVSEAHDAVSRILTTRKALEAAGKRIRSSKKHLPMGTALIQELNAILGQLVELRFRGIDDQMLVYPLQLNNKIISLQGVVASADARPTEQVEEEFKNLSAQLETQLAHLNKVLEKKIPAFNRLVRREGIPAVPVKGNAGGK